MPCEDVHKPLKAQEMTGPAPSQNPKEIAERAERIYEEKYRQKYEKKHLGRFLVIEVDSHQVFLGDTPDAAYDEARKKFPQGFFHLIKVGSPGAFRVSYSPSASVDWIFQ